MDIAPETDGHLAGAVRRVLWRLMAIGHNRAELLMVEMEEERERAQVILFLAAGVGVFGILATLTLTALIACAFAAHLLLVLGVLTGVYGIVAGALYFKISRMLRQWETLGATRQELEKDRECLEKKLT